jgi:hypothetical protein|tara:strand:+ start:28 stop:195 length:168 start_codon:yes stop_codon:yes gene_type:complete
VSNEYFKIYAGHKHAWNIDMGYMFNLVLDWVNSMSRASINVWLFFILIMLSGVEL